MIFIFIQLVPIIVQSQSARYDIKKISGIESKRINDKRQVAGNVGRHAARWEDDAVIQYPGLSSDYSRANCINNLGEMAGWSIDGSGVRHAVVFKKDTSIVLLEGVSNYGGEADGMNDFGDVVGTYVFCDSVPCRPSDRHSHAVLWQGGTIHDLGAIEDAESIASAVNNWGLVVGTAAEGSTFDARAFKTSGVGLIPLGELGGGWSAAYDVNDNGLIVGASGETKNVSRAVIWNPGITNIQTLPGILSIARAVNNSDQVVGEIQTPSGWKGFIWENGMMQALDSLVHPDSGWVIERAVDINDQGDILALGRKNNIGSYVILINGLTITRPSCNEKWLGGEKDTIKWTGGIKDHIVELKYSVDSCRTFDIIDYVPHADSGYYVWDVPQHIISKQCFIRAMDFNDPSIIATSDVFKIKPYILTRDSSGKYEPYRPEQDQWTFANIPQDMFPPEWYQQFDYQGTDPFTGYSYLFALPPLFFTISSASSFPDWVSWVRAFGIDACYFDTSFPPIYSPSAVSKWFSISGTWHGSCFGLAASNALTFSYKNQFQARYNSFPGFADPVTVASDTSVKRVVNELFTHQFGIPSRPLIYDFNYITPNKTLHELKAMLREDNVVPRTLSFGNNNGPGAHNVLPYKLVQDEATKNFYYVFVYDNNFPNSTTIIRIDTLGNSNHGVWMPQYGNPAWGGPRKFMLMTESSDYFSNAALPKRKTGYSSPFILASDELEIYPPLNANTRIIDRLGNVTGYHNGSVLEGIPNSVPLFYLDGSETPPYGYLLPTAKYSITVERFASDTVRTLLFTGAKTFFYQRFNTEPNQTDRLYFDGGVAVSNPDPQSKTINLLSIVNETSQEKLISFSGIKLAMKDSIRIETLDNKDIKLTSLGTAKSYDLEIHYITKDGVDRFRNMNISLAANTTHTATPDWSNLTDTDLRILVDIGNNGTMDDTLKLENIATGAEDAHSSPRPQEYRLAQNYPNPFNASTVIRYQLPISGTVTLKVFDVLGKEVATLADGYRSAGYYNVEFKDLTQPSGIYLYKLQAGSNVETRKMVLLR